MINPSIASNFLKEGHLASRNSNGMFMPTLDFVPWPGIDRLECLIFALPTATWYWLRVENFTDTISLDSIGTLLTISRETASLERDDINYHLGGVKGQRDK